MTSFELRWLEPPEPAGRRVVLEAVTSGTVNLTVANQRGPHYYDQLVGCGTWKVSLDGEPVSSFLWSESRGHGLVLGAGGEPFVVEDDEGYESLGGALNYTERHRGQQVKAGQKLTIELANLHVKGRGLFQPYVRIEGDAGFRILQDTPTWFNCGSGVHTFSGHFAQVGYHAGPVVAGGAFLDVEAPMRARASFGVAHPLGDGACEVSIRDQASTVRSGMRHEHCGLSVVVEPGPVRFTIHATAGFGPMVAWWMYEEAG